MIGTVGHRNRKYIRVDESNSYYYFVDSQVALCGVTVASSKLFKPFEKTNHSNRSNNIQQGDK